MINETTYNALSKAAKEVGYANYNSGLKAHMKAGRKRHTYRYQPTEAHRDVVSAMIDPKITDEQAMALILTPDVFRERYGRNPW